MSEYTDKFTIVISAPHGALGEYLAALLEHTVNHDTSVDLRSPKLSNRPSQAFFHDMEYMFANQDAQTSFAEFVNSWAGQLPTEPDTRVILTSQQIADVVEAFPNSKIININTTTADANQLGFNYFIKESAMAGKTTPELNKFKYKAEQLFGPTEQVIDWDYIATDPQVLDNAPAQYVIKLLGATLCSRTNMDTSACASPALDINFAELCNVTTKNHAADNALAIAKIYDFLDVLATQELETVQNIWIDFMDSFTSYRDIG